MSGRSAAIQRTMTEQRPNKDRTKTEQTPSKDRTYSEQSEAAVGERCRNSGLSFGGDLGWDRQKPLQGKIPFMARHRRQRRERRFSSQPARPKSPSKHTGLRRSLYRSHHRRSTKVASRGCDKGARLLPSPAATDLLRYLRCLL